MAHPHTIVLTDKEGRQAVIDYSEGRVTYSGDLPVDDAARLFFDCVGQIVLNAAAVGPCLIH